MKITDDVKKRRDETLRHLGRINGQLNTLKTYIEEDRCCSEIAMLTTSIAKSFDSLRTRTLEGFVINQLLDGVSVAPKKLKMLVKIMKLHKK